MEQLTGHQIVAATNNQHKLSEIRPLLEPDFRILSLEDIGCYDELPETSATIEGNSMQKASYVYEKYKVPCIADDTGLEVTSLNGEPGVYSARYAGDHKNSDDNIALLLARLGNAPDREARFKTVITLVSAKGFKTFEGIIDGKILYERRGSGGFGYDSVFQPTGYNKTLAEMTLGEKNKISHRGLAIEKLVQYLHTQQEI